MVTKTPHRLFLVISKLEPRLIAHLDTVSFNFSLLLFNFILKTSLKGGVEIITIVLEETGAQRSKVHMVTSCIWYWWRGSKLELSVLPEILKKDTLESLRCDK